MVDTILFDLDGTLLPMDQGKFVECYLGLLAKKMAPHGYDPRTLVKTIWEGTQAMVMNDGTRRNDEAFWARFTREFGDEALKDMPIFDDFYANDFRHAQSSCGYDPKAAELIGLLKKKGFRLVLATNPLFPGTATHQRVGWAGLKPKDFALVTVYENSRHCKPNPEYYRDIVNELGLAPERCMMIGNDVSEDMVAGALGMQTFLLTDCLINKKNEDIGNYRHGTLAELVELVKENRLV